MNPNSFATVIDLAAMRSRKHSDVMVKSFRTGVACLPYQRNFPRQDMSTLEGCPPAGKCKDTLASVEALAVAIGAAPVLVIPIAVKMRVDKIVVVTSGAAGFRLTNFIINNVPQWTLGQPQHSAIFAPGGDANTAFQGDYVDPGSLVNITAANLDGAAVQSIWITLQGPGA